MAATPLHIAWLGPAPGDDGGVPGVAAELLYGLAALGHRIDCYFPSSGQRLPARLEGVQGITFNWGTAEWQWDRWYSRTRMTALASGMLARALASVRLRRQIVSHHERDPYDVVYQFSSIESLAVPGALRGSVPLVIHPETHTAGELRSLIAERRLSLRCQSRRRVAMVAAMLALRSLVQRSRVRRANLLVCISAVFRDHLVSDYGFPRAATVVVPNPVRIGRFAPSARPPGSPATVLVLGRIAARKGIESVVALARTLLARGVDAQVRVVGGPSLWSDYTKLLEDLPAENSLYVGAIDGMEIPRELARADVLLQASNYEPFALTVAEALAAGVPVIGTSEVGAIEGVAREVCVEVAPGDVEAMADGVAELLARLGESPEAVRANARTEAQRLFAPEVVCGQISSALERLVHGVATVDGPTSAATGAPESST